MRSRTLARSLPRNLTNLTPIDPPAPASVQNRSPRAKNPSRAPSLHPRSSAPPRLQLPPPLSTGRLRPTTNQFDQRTSSGQGRIDLIEEGPSDRMALSFCFSRQRPRPSRDTPTASCAVPRDWTRAAALETRHRGPASCLAESTLAADLRCACRRRDFDFIMQQSSASCDLRLILQHRKSEAY